MFDKKTFSEILTKIYNTYPNQRKFAEATGVNRGYLSRYINMKIDNPPTPKILDGIAKASNGLISYYELMNICGYMTFNFENKSKTIEMQLCEYIYETNLNELNEFNLSNNEYIDLKKILIDRDIKNTSIESQLNTFVEKTNSSNINKLLSTILKINREMEDALQNLIKNGLIYPIPVYKNSKNIDLFLTSDIISYINLSIPINEKTSDFFALSINDDKMSPLLDVGDIAIVYKNDNLANGDVVAAYSITKECCIIGKLFKYDDLIEFTYLNSKSEKFLTNDIKFLGKIIKAEIQSAFK